MKIVLLVLCVASVYGQVVDQASDPQSVFGESYWCSSLKTAKASNAVDHCIDTVWAKHILPEDSADVCTFCKNIVSDVKKAIDNNKTLPQLKQYLDATCDLIPISQLKDQCKSYVDNCLDDLEKMIHKLDPAAVCAAIGLCKGFEDKAHKLHSVPLQKASKLAVNTKGDICVDCKTLMDDVKAQITSKTTEDQLKALLKAQVCANLGPLETECNQLVDQYLPELLELLSSTVDSEQICELLGFCQGGDHTLLAKMRLKKSPLFAAASKANSEECTICQVLMAELQAIEKMPPVQKEIENVIKNQLCVRLGSFEDECISTVEQYGPMLFDLLAKELDPDSRCKALGFCTSSTQSVLRQAMPATKKQEHKVVQSAKCELCELIIKELDSLIGENATEQEIIDALDKVCSLLPQIFADECKDFVNTYGPAIIELLLSELEPKQICTALGLCSETTQNRPAPGIKTDEECGICETVVQYVDSLLQENTTEAKIKEMLEKVCNFLPDTIKEPCDILVDLYLEQLIALIAKGLSPKEVCTELGLCKDGMAMSMPMLKIIPAKLHLLGEKECTYGPSYWCASVENAKKCKAEAHCYKHVWNRN